MDHSRAISPPEVDDEETFGADRLRRLAGARRRAAEDAAERPVDFGEGRVDFDVQRLAPVLGGEEAFARRGVPAVHRSDRRGELAFFLGTRRPPVDRQRVQKIPSIFFEASAILGIRIVQIFHHPHAAADDVDLHLVGGVRHRLRVFDVMLQLLPQFPKTGAHVRGRGDDDRRQRNEGPDGASDQTRAERLRGHPGGRLGARHAAGSAVDIRCGVASNR
jgi:hypothetical protein